MAKPNAGTKIVVTTTNTEPFWKGWFRGNKRIKQVPPVRKLPPAPKTVDGTR